MREEKSIIPTFVTLTHANGPRISIREDRILAVRDNGKGTQGAHLFIARDENHEVVPIRESAEDVPGPFARFNLSEGRVLRLNIHFIAAISHSQKHNCTAIIDTNGSQGVWLIKDSTDKATEAVRAAWENLAP